MSKFMKTFSDNNLKKYDTAINIILIVLSLLLLVPIIQFLMKKVENNEDFYTRVALKANKPKKGASYALGAGAALPKGLGLSLPPKKTT